MPYFTWNRARGIAGTLGAAACVALITSAPASAGSAPVAADGTVTAATTMASSVECAAPALLQPFSSWRDNRHYVLAPGGDFNDATGGGWQLGGGASVVDETDPDGTVDGVLDLPSGAVAVSPTMCVDLDYPTARTWVRNVGRDGDVNVSVIYDAGKSAQVPKVVGNLHANKQRTWGLSDDVKIQPQLAGKQAGWRRVAFVLTAGGDSGDSTSTTSTSTRGWSGSSPRRGGGVTSSPPSDGSPGRRRRERRPAPVRPGDHRHPRRGARFREGDRRRAA